MGIPSVSLNKLKGEDVDIWFHCFLAEIQEAISINPLPSYQQLQANILFAQKKYEEAYDIYMQLTNSPLRNAEIFFGAAKCKALLRDTTAMLSLMDSCMNTFSKPYLKEAAHFLWARAEARRDAGKYRDAISDMNEYGNLMSASINDNFYYIRHQTEIQARLYQQALNDISQAIQMVSRQNGRSILKKNGRIHCRARRRC